MLYYIILGWKLYLEKWDTICVILLKSLSPQALFSPGWIRIILPSWNPFDVLRIKIYCTVSCFASREKLNDWRCTCCIRHLPYIILVLFLVFFPYVRWRMWTWCKWLWQQPMSPCWNLHRSAWWLYLSLSSWMGWCKLWNT